MATIKNPIEHHAKISASKTAIIYGKKILTYKQLHQQIIETAQILSENHPNHCL